MAEVKEEVKVEVKEEDAKEQDDKDWQTDSNHSGDDHAEGMAGILPDIRAMSRQAVAASMMELGLNIS